MDGLEIGIVRTAGDLAEALRIRTRVFVEEQHVAIEEELDAYDVVLHDDARDAPVVHVLARLEGVPVATARLLFDAHGAVGAPMRVHLSHIGRVAVLAEHRGRGVGTAVMAMLHDEVRRRGLEGVAISAQEHAVTFYESLGYVAYGPVYFEAGIEHRAMTIHFAGQIDRPA